MGSFSNVRLGVLCAALLSAGSALADDAGTVSAASLEVKSRIASMEQVNVTADLGIDETAPAPSAAVNALLQELASIEGGLEKVLQPAAAKTAESASPAG